MSVDALEGPPQPRLRDGSRRGLGVVLVIATIVIGGGTWVLTRMKAEPEANSGGATPGAAAQTPTPTPAEHEH